MRNPCICAPVALRSVAYAEPSANNGSKKDVYQIVPLPTPENAVLEVGGMDWMPDGRLMVCTRRGEVWAMSHSLSGEIEWKLFATGLQEALGILHGDKPNEVYVMQRPELTRLVDTKNIGVADKYETVNADFGFSGNYHEFAYGPVRDKDGNFIISLNLAHAPDSFGGPLHGHAQRDPVPRLERQDHPRRQIRPLLQRHALAQRPERRPRRRDLLLRQPGRVDRPPTSCST